MRARAVMGVLIGLGVSGNPGPCRAQTLEEGRCAACAIQVDTIAILNGSDGFPGWPNSVATGRAGRLFMTFPNYDSFVTVLDARGNVVAPIGVEGHGPGEFLAPSYVGSTPADSILIIDPPNARLSIFDSTLSFVRSIPVPPTTLWAVAVHGGFVVNARVSTPGRAGLPLHRLGEDGEIKASFGATTPVLLPWQPGAYRRQVAMSPEGNLWLIPYAGSYSIELWSPGGRLLRRLRRVVDWYPDSDASWDQIEGRPPFPRVRGFWRDDDGLLWVVTSVPAGDWRAGLGETRLVEGRRYYTIEDYSKTFDSIVEVIDPEAAVVVASRRVDDGIAVFVRPGTMAIASTDEEYATRLTLVRLHLSRR